MKRKAFFILSLIISSIFISSCSAKDLITKNENSVDLEEKPYILDFLDSQDGTIKECRHEYKRFIQIYTDTEYGYVDSLRYHMVDCTSRRSFRVDFCNFKKYAELCDGEFLKVSKVTPQKYNGAFYHQATYSCEKCKKSSFVKEYFMCSGNEPFCTGECENALAYIEAHKAKE